MAKKIKRNTPSVGSSYERSWKNKIYKMRVVKTENGIGYEVDGKIYAYPSGAAKSITKQEVNGWRFWHL